MRTLAASGGRAAPVAPLGLGVALRRLVSRLVEAISAVLDGRLLHGEGARPRRVLRLDRARAPHRRRARRLREGLARPSRPSRGAAPHRPHASRRARWRLRGATTGLGDGGLRRPRVGQGELRPALLRLAPERRLGSDVPGDPAGEDLVERDGDAHEHDDRVARVLDQVGDLPLERRAYLVRVRVRARVRGLGLGG